jgi:purine-nucleoside phosphorylase
MELPVFAISAITDLCSPEKVRKISLAEVLAGAAKAEPGMSLIIRELVKSL